MRTAAWLWTGAAVAPSSMRKPKGMSPEFLYGLVLMAAAAHAIWNALIKRAADAVLMMAAIRLTGLLFGLAALPFVPWPRDAAVTWLALACVGNFAYHGLLIQSYRVGDLSLVYPLARGSAPVLLALIAFVAIDERLASTQIAAVVLIAGGIIVLVTGRGKRSQGRRPRVRNRDLDRHLLFLRRAGRPCQHERSRLSGLARDHHRPWHTDLCYGEPLWPNT